MARLGVLRRGLPQVVVAIGHQLRASERAGRHDDGEKSPDEHGDSTTPPRGFFPRLALRYARDIVSNVVNLNKFRKRKAKEEKRKRAETNVRLHGRTKAERELEAKQKELLERRVDGARLSESTEGDDDG